MSTAISSPGVHTIQMHTHMLQYYMYLCTCSNCVLHTHMTTHGTSPPISTTHIHKTSAHTHESQQSIWRQLPDVPYYRSSVCVVDGVLLAVGGAEDQSGSKKTSSIYGLYYDDKKWKHVGDMPFACSSVDTLLLSDGGLLVVNGHNLCVLKITVQGKYCLYRS